MPQPTLHTPTAPLSRTTVPAVGTLPGCSWTTTARYAPRGTRNHPAPVGTLVPQPAQKPVPSAARVLPAHLRTPAGSQA